MENKMLFIGALGEFFSGNGRHTAIGHAYRGGKAILLVAGRRLEFDAGGDESTQFVGASLSLHPEVVTRYCWFSWK